MDSNLGVSGRLMSTRSCFGLMTPRALLHQPDAEEAYGTLLLADPDEGYSCVLLKLPELTVDGTQAPFSGAMTGRPAAAIGYDWDRWPWSCIAGLRRT